MIETTHLILRPFEKTDSEDLFEILRGPLINCFKCMEVKTMLDTKKALEERIKERKYYFAVCLKDSGKVIGEICAHPESMSPEDDMKDTFSPCWLLHPQYRGQGLMYEAACAYFNFLFDHRNARRIYIYTEDYNIACQRLSEKLGMRKEGIFKEFVSFVKDENGNPIYENTMQYAILRSEWNEKGNC